MLRCGETDKSSPSTARHKDLTGLDQHPLRASRGLQLVHRTSHVRCESRTRLGRALMRSAMSSVSQGTLRWSSLIASRSTLKCLDPRPETHFRAVQNVEPRGRALALGDVEQHGLGTGNGDHLDRRRDTRIIRC